MPSEPREEKTRVLRDIEGIDIDNISGFWTTEFPVMICPYIAVSQSMCTLPFWSSDTSYPLLSVLRVGVFKGENRKVFKKGNNEKAEFYISCSAASRQLTVLIWLKEWKYLFEKNHSIASNNF